MAKMLAKKNQRIKKFGSIRKHLKKNTQNIQTVFKSTYKTHISQRKKMCWQPTSSKWISNAKDGQEKCYLLPSKWMRKMKTISIFFLQFSLSCYSHHSVSRFFSSLKIFQIQFRFYALFLFQLKRNFPDEQIQ